MNAKSSRRVFREEIQSFLRGRSRHRKELRPYQAEAIERVSEWLHAGEQRAHVVHATGLGKTRTFSNLVGIARDMNCLIVVPTKVLVEQTARALANRLGRPVEHLSSLTAIRGDQEDEIVAVRGTGGSGTLVTTYKSLVLNAGMLAREFKPKFIVCDECHWAYTDDAQDALASFPTSMILGLTATPDHIGVKRRRGYVKVVMDNGRLLYGDPNRFASAHFGPKIDERTTRWGINNQWLSPLAWGRIRFNFELGNIPLAQSEAGLDYAPTALNKALQKNWADMTKTIVQLYRQGEYDLPEKHAIAVCPNVTSAEYLANAVANAGVPAAVISHMTRPKERQELLKAYRNGQLKLLTSVMVLREGLDVPIAEICMMLKLTKLRIPYDQPLGRVLRLNKDTPGKTALMLDAHFEDNARLQPLTAVALYGTEGQEVRERGILVDWERGGNPPPPTPELPENIRPVIEIVSHPTEEPDLLEKYETWEEASAEVRRMGVKTRKEYGRRSRENRRLPSQPHVTYASVWRNKGRWRGFLGNADVFYPTWEEASAAVRKQGIENSRQFKLERRKDSRLPGSPHVVYKDVWEQNGKWRGFFSGNPAGVNFYPTWEEASLAARRLGIKTYEEYKIRYREDARLTSIPHRLYASVWKQRGGWYGFLGTETTYYSTWEEASAAAQRLHLTNRTEYRYGRPKDPKLHSAPNTIYTSVWKKNGGWPGFLGTLKESKRNKKK